MNVIAASTLAFLTKPLSEAIEDVAALGFRGIEIYYEGAHALSERELRDLLSPYDLRPFLHAPFSDLNLASFN
ncbi:MAG: sugar phosphate isomerase/epimerase, partial [Methanobacteriota archaeon]